jgi:hypothetical protein
VGGASVSAIDKLYPINNKTIKKTINIEDSLYNELMKFTLQNYDATFSEIINVCIEDYIERNTPSFYEKPKGETVTYRSIMIRKDNLSNLTQMYKKTGISVTRLLNGAVKEFLAKYNK